mgnify:CR=1 FL=1
MLTTSFSLQTKTTKNNSETSLSEQLLPLNKILTNLPVNKKDSLEESLKSTLSYIIYFIQNQAENVNE